MTAYVGFDPGGRRGFRPEGRQPAAGGGRVVADVGGAARAAAARRPQAPGDPRGRDAAAVRPCVRAFIFGLPVFFVPV